MYVCIDKKSRERTLVCRKASCGLRVHDALKLSAEVKTLIEENNQPTK